MVGFAERQTLDLQVSRFLSVAQVCNAPADKGMAMVQAFEDDVSHAFAVNNYWASTRRSRAGAWVQFSLHSCTAHTLVIYVI